MCSAPRYQSSIEKSHPIRSLRASIKIAVPRRNKPAIRNVVQFAVTSLFTMGRTDVIANLSTITEKRPRIEHLIGIKALKYFPVTPND